MKNPFAVAQKYLVVTGLSLPKNTGDSGEGGETDPVLTVDQWYPHFRDFHHKVVGETPDFSYLWLKLHRPELYAGIKAIENRIDALGEVRLSEVMGLMQEWRELILKAEMERRKHETRS